MQIEDVSNKAIEILNKAYARRLVPDETGGFVASIQEFPGCVAEGETADAAIQNLDKVAASWVEVALSTGYEIRDPVSFHGYSGKIALRLPRGLHKQMAELAELEECSINQLLVTAIAQFLGNKKAFNDMAEKVLSEMRKVLTDGAVSIYRHSPTTLSLMMTFSHHPQHFFRKSETIVEGELVTKQFNLGSNNQVVPKLQ